MNQRITPEIITNDLPKDGVFVFGSNEAGIHGAGAAKLAYEVYGARLGQGFGLSANSFAIPTKDWEITVLPLPVIEFYVKRFIAFAKKTMSYKWNFYVTKIGCGLAGYGVKDIAPMFKECVDMKNMYLPQDFLDFYEGIYVEPVNNKTFVYGDNSRIEA